MPTFKKCDKPVRDLCEIIMRKHHEPLVDHKIRVDLLFAYGDRDEATDALVGPAITHGGYPCTGLARVVSYKDRVKGLGDVEVTLDGDWWKDAPEEQRKALLDHELQHFAVTDKVDDLGRPKIKMRKHDVQVGWFKVIAERHGASSQEQIQAKQVFDQHGQAFFPGLEIAKGEAGRMAHLEVRGKKA